MNKNVVMIGAVAGLGVMLFMWKKGNSKNPKLGIPGANLPPPAKSGAPSQNQNQPWYTGPTAFLQNKAQGYVQNPALAQSDLQSVVKSTSDVWGTVSGLFGTSSGSDASPGTSPNVDATPDFNSSDPSAADPTASLPASDVTQSNMIGDQMALMNQNNLDTSTISTDPSSDSALATIDTSDPESMGSDNVLSA